MERKIGIDDSDESHVRKVQAFGDHLGPQQDIEFARSEISENPPVIFLSLERIRIHPADLGSGKELAQRFLDSLCADPCVLDLRIAAFGLGTDRRHSR